MTTSTTVQLNGPNNTKRRPSYIDLSGTNAIIGGGDSLLSPRTPKSISKSRRSSIVAEHVQGAAFTDPGTASWTGSSSRRNSIVNTLESGRTQLTPQLLSESATSDYFQLEIQPHKLVDADTSREKEAATSVFSTSTAVPPNFDGHMSHKDKTNKTSRKLNRFFGEHAPHDICVREIEREGLKAMLQSKTPLCYFLYHLLEEYSSENLFFFIEIEQYETFNYVSPLQQLATAQHIYNTYLTPNSYFEVNLDDKVRRAVTAALEQKRVNGLFDVAKRSVYSLLESSYMRFTETDTFQTMVMNCGQLTTHYDLEMRNAAVKQLLTYIDRQHAMICTNPHTDAPAFAQMSRRRHELVKSMVNEFCRTMVGIDFSQQRPEPAVKQSASMSTRTFKSRTGKCKFDFFKK